MAKETEEAGVDLRTTKLKEGELVMLISEGEDPVILNFEKFVHVYVESKELRKLVRISHTTMGYEALMMIYGGVVLHSPIALGSIKNPKAETTLLVPLASELDMMGGGEHLSAQKIYVGKASIIKNLGGKYDAFAQIFERQGLNFKG